MSRGIDADQLRTGLDAGDIIVLVDVGGAPGLPITDGSNLTGVVSTGVTSPIKDMVIDRTFEVVACRHGGVLFLHNESC